MYLLGALPDSKYQPSIHACRGTLVVSSYIKVWPALGDAVVCAHSAFSARPAA
jgi:hypothetical protein